MGGSVVFKTYRNKNLIVLCVQIRRLVHKLIRNDYWGPFTLEWKIPIHLHTLPKSLTPSFRAIDSKVVG